MALQEQLENTLKNHFTLEFMHLENESHLHAGPAAESHFKLTLVSPDFEGLAKVKRQQAVYKALADLMPQFHALGMHTYTPSEWQINQQQVPQSPQCAGGHK